MQKMLLETCHRLRQLRAFFINKEFDGLFIPRSNWNSYSFVLLVIQTVMIHHL